MSFGGNVVIDLFFHTVGLGSVYQVLIEPITNKRKKKRHINMDESFTIRSIT